MKLIQTIRQAARITSPQLYKCYQRHEARKFRQFNHKCTYIEKVPPYNLVHIIGCNINKLPYFGDSIGNIVIPEDKHCIKWIGLEFYLVKNWYKSWFLRQIIDVILTCSHGKTTCSLLIPGKLSQFVFVQHWLQSLKQFSRVGRLTF